MTKEQLFMQLVEALSDKGLFFGHAVIDAQDEAMMVMMHLFGHSVDQILASGHDKIDKKIVNRSEELISQRINSLKPMAYILGEVQFAGLTFKSDKRALVPRSPIAELIMNDFQRWLDISKVKRALDLCTGSGCIGIALAQRNPSIEVDISDISIDALELAETNVELNKVKQNVKAFCSDLFDKLSNTYDLIVTNPPYVSESEYQELPDEYKLEPKLGLTTEHDGLRIPVTIMLEAPSYLNDNGFLFLEVGYTDELLDDLFPNIQFEWISFNNGGQGVCVFTKEQLSMHSNDLKQFLHHL